MKSLPARTHPWKTGFLSVFGLIAGMTTSSFAQETDDVMLKYASGDQIKGRLIYSNDTVLTLQTVVGIVTVPVAEVSCTGSACPTAIAQSASVVLTSLDGQTVIVGELAGMSDDNYEVDTIAGQILVDRTQVTCEGDGCPEAVPEAVANRNVILTGGGNEIEGELIAFDGSTYTIEVDALGVLKADASVYQCRGNSCP